MKCAREVLKLKREIKELDDLGKMHVTDKRLEGRVRELEDKLAKATRALESEMYESKPLDPKGKVAADVLVGLSKTLMGDGLEDILNESVESMMKQMADNQADHKEATEFQKALDKI